MAFFLRLISNTDFVFSKKLYVLLILLEAIITREVFQEQFKQKRRTSNGQNALYTAV